MTPPILATITLLQGDIPFLRCPDNMLGHLAKVLDGEYDPSGIDFKDPNLIVDVGANCGAFAHWAHWKWPGARLVCYEPASLTYSILTENLGRASWAELHNCAVGDASRTKLFAGPNNNGEASLYEQVSGNGNGFEEVRTIPGDELPAGIDILKMDCEGSERAILERLLLRQRPSLIMLEYHGDGERHMIDSILIAHYILIGSLATRPNFGVVKYLRKDLLK